MGHTRKVGAYRSRVLLSFAALVAVGLVIVFGSNALFASQSAGRRVCYVVGALSLLAAAITLYREMWRIYRRSPRS
jgi:glucan phosphoethanolaminetransferase (alkaline phosphatase superfamily)